MVETFYSTETGANFVLVVLLKLFLAREGVIAFVTSIEVLVFVLDMLCQKPVFREILTTEGAFFMSVLVSAALDLGRKRSAAKSAF